MEVPKSLVRKKKVQLIAVRKQNVSLDKPVTFNELNFSCLPYNEYLINRV